MFSIEEHKANGKKAIIWFSILILMTILVGILAITKYSFTFKEHLISNRMLLNFNGVIAIINRKEEHQDNTEGYQTVADPLECHIAVISHTGIILSLI